MGRKKGGHGHGHGRGGNKKKKEKEVEKKVEVDSDAEGAAEYPEWYGEVNDEGIPKFLLGEEVSKQVDAIVENFTMRTPDGAMLLQGVDIRFIQGRRYGLIGKNGIGKTTLLTHIKNGTIEGWPNQLFVHLVEQEVPADTLTVMDHVMSANRELNRLLAFEEKLNEAMESEEGAPENFEVLMEVIEEKRTELQVWDTEHRATQILDGLQFTKKMQQATTATLSGGWRMRVSLAKALFLEPDILMLDEPTNHLDFPAVIWLQKYLQSFPKTVLVVSHDREFLNEVVTDVVEFRNHNLDYYRGDFVSYNRVRGDNFKEQKSRYDAQQREIKKKTAFIERFRTDENNATLVQSRIKELKKMVRLEEPREDKNIRFRFPDPEKMRSEADLCRINDVSFSWDPAAEERLLKNLNLNIDMKSRIGILGANGTGKSTLIKLILREIEPCEGKLVFNEEAIVACFTQHHVDQLDLTLNPVQLLQARFEDVREQMARNHLGAFGLSGDLALQRIGTLSGGQKSRVTLAMLTWQHPHILIMDEPTNHLDMESIDALANCINEYTGAVIIVSHDQYFLEKTLDEFWALDSKGNVDKLFDFDAAKEHCYILPEEDESKRAEKRRKKSAAATRKAERAAALNDLSSKDRKNQARNQRSKQSAAQNSRSGARNVRG